MNIDDILNELILSRKVIDGIINDIEAGPTYNQPFHTFSRPPYDVSQGLPLVSIGPSGIGGEYQKELLPKKG